MIEKRAVVQNAAGIHCRPSSVIINERRAYEARILVERDGESLELGSVMDLLSLGLAQGEHVNIRASGPDEAEACDHMVALFERHFDFPPRRGAPAQASHTA